MKHTLLFLLLFCIPTFGQAQRKTTFILGSDLSEMKKAEDAGIKYKIQNKTLSGLRIHKKYGINWVRLRIFHTPDGKGPVCNSLDYTLDFAKQVKQNKQKLLLDFHYSDTWADPGKQFTPKAWQGLNPEQIGDSIYTYTRNVLLSLKKQNTLPDMIQIGNEISNGMIWPLGKLNKENIEGWKNFTLFINKGIEGVRSIYGKRMPPIMIHYDNGGNKAKCEWFYDKIREHNIQYDYIGLSYYPFWHGGFSQLQENLQNLTTRYGKEVIIVETGFDFFLPNKTENADSYAAQKANMDTLFNVVRKNPMIKGVIYWGGSWIGGKQWETNDRYRSAMFDSTGTALPIFDSFLNEKILRKK